jgi:nucleoside-diphosphate-sugar epimerase
MRVLLTGAGGFIGRHVRASLPHAEPVPHASVATVPLEGVDVVIHAGRYRPAGPGRWQLCDDPEAALMVRVGRSGARYVMLSSRAVYGPAGAEPLREDHPVAPTSEYGRHKLRLEEHGHGLLGDRLTILRLSNVFGFEWPGRPTFFGIMLDRLAAEGSIRFDMAPDTRRDFIPVQAAAAMIARLAADPLPGLFNIGAGHSVACGTLAEAVIQGFGRGRLIVSDPVPRDSFDFDTGRARHRTGVTISKDEVIEAARAAGRQLART